MRRKSEQRNEARKLRMDGISIFKISQIVKASKSSVSVWVRDIKLNEIQKNKLIERKSIQPRKRIINCKKCGKNLSVCREKNYFCSMDCYLSFKKREVIEKKINACLFCGNPSKNKFCSTMCFFDYNWRIKIKNAIDTGLAPSCQSTAKILIEKLNSHRCEVCLNTIWLDEPIPLVLDHINGNPDDWRIINLRLVCGNCNMRLPTFTSKNRSKTKVDKRNIYRRNYYKQNISKTKITEECDNGSRLDSKSSGVNALGGSSPSSSAS